jgi:hypothetical protein
MYFPMWKINVGFFVCIYIWMKIQGNASTIKLLMLIKESIARLCVGSTKFQLTLITQKKGFLCCKAFIHLNLTRREIISTNVAKRKEMCKVGSSWAFWDFHAISSFPTGSLYFFSISNGKANLFTPDLIYCSTQWSYYKRIYISSNEKIMC